MTAAIAAPGTLPPQCRNHGPFHREDNAWRSLCRSSPQSASSSIPACGCLDKGRPMPSIDLAKTPSFRLDGKRALVTGGGRGIGLAAASALATAGAHVTLAARTKAEIEDAAAAIRPRGENADALGLDATDVAASPKAPTAAKPSQILTTN